MSDKSNEFIQEELDFQEKKLKEQREEIRHYSHELKLTLLRISSAVENIAETNHVEIIEQKEQELEQLLKKYN